MLWGVLALTLITLILIAYFVHGGPHGLSADDYVYKYSEYDLATGGWRPDWSLSPARTLSYLLAPILANALPSHELPVRLGIIALQLLNTLLLGALAYRLTSSRLTAFLSSAFFLVPVFASEPVLWFSGAVFYLPSLFFLLVGLHLVLSCYSAKKQFPLLLGAVVAWCAMILFIESGFFILLLVPALVWMRNERGVQLRLKPALIAMSATYALFVAYGFLALRIAPVVALHGSTTFDPIYIVTQRIPETINGLADYARDWAPGGTFQEALNLGAREWLSFPAGWGIAGLALCGLILTALLYSPGETARESSGRSAKLFLLGIVWMGLALAPTLFFAGLQPSPRVLFFPSAGFALALAGVLGWLVDRLKRWRGIGVRVLVLLAGFSVLLCSLTMAGLVSVRQLRWERDRDQLTALGPAISSLPDSPIWVVPIALDEITVRPYLGRRTTLDQYLLGVFQIPWAAEPALRMEYGKENLQVIDEDAQGNVHLTGLGYAKNGEIDSLTFGRPAGGQEVPITQLLAFSFQRNRLILFKRFTITMPDGTESEVALPLAAQVASPQIVTRTTTLKLEGDSP